MSDTTTTEDGGGEQDFFDAELGIEIEGLDSGGRIDMASLATSTLGTSALGATFGVTSEPRRDRAAVQVICERAPIINNTTPPAPHHRSDDSPPSEKPAPKQKQKQKQKQERPSLPDHILVPVPRIPARFRFLLDPQARHTHLAGESASASASATTTTATTAATTSASSSTASTAGDIARPRTTAAGERATTPKLHLSRHLTKLAGSSANYELTTRSLASSSKSAPSSPTRATRPSSTLRAAPSSVFKMMRFDRLSRRPDDDLFLDLADEQKSPTAEDSITQARRSMSRTSYTSKRRSLPVDTTADRPSTSGSIYTRAPSRLDTLRSSFDMPRYSEPQRSSTSRAPSMFDDNASASGRSQMGRARRFSVLADRSPLSPSRHAHRDRELTESPELSHYHRRRLSFATAPSEPDTQRTDAHIYNRGPDSQESSPAEHSDPQRTDSSADSQTADTVWDELDELKSRIKSLEASEKKPPASNAAASGDSNDRPRTATTAPTTIDSSPKQQRKPAAVPKEESTTPTSENAGISAAASSHPLLHDALTRSKGLLSSTVYRALEASAADALQLATMTGIGGPQGTNFTPASVINGVTVNDRGTRRKADNLCRNLTDLCIALCESKHEAPNVVSSPVSVDTAVPIIPLRQSRSTSLALSSSQPSRPLSRLEARRSSLLGTLSRADSEANSPRGSIGDMSASEADSTPSHSNTLPPRRLSAAPSRTLKSRTTSQGEYAGEEEPRFRPLSRAMTDVGGLRVKSRIGGEDRSPGAQRRTPSLRESLAAKRGSDGGYDSSREIPRASSFAMDPRRRRPAPVLEEEDSTDYQQRRPQHTSRRPATEVPSRTSSLLQRRQLLAE